MRRNCAHVFLSRTCGKSPEVGVLWNLIEAINEGASREEIASEFNETLVAIRMPEVVYNS